MMKINLEKQILKSFLAWNQAKIISIIPLAESGSNRSYFRVCYTPEKSCLAVYNKDILENLAYIKFTEQFLAKNINVPQIYFVDPSQEIYFVEDLGDLNLYSYIQNAPEEEIKKTYFKVLEKLLEIQIIGGKDFDYSHAYPIKSFDQQGMQWDLNTFKYYFLKLAQIPFHEQDLETDFKLLLDYLSKIDHHYFLYRDFQSRNIMLKDNTIYFIDFQGGRQGALAYDLAALLYNAKANLSEDFRLELLDHYTEHLTKYLKIDKAVFKKEFYAFALIRILQALGTYGLRGYFERKEYFLKSIPFALRNLARIFNNPDFEISLEHIKKISKELLEKYPFTEAIETKPSKLKVSICSFSYRKSYPKDESGNGGGYIFDCRFLYNPGRIEEFKSLSGLDKVVIEHLQADPKVGQFIEKCTQICIPAIDNYIERDFEELSIGFGCTGGQHRSVYSAQELAKKLKSLYPNIEVNVEHKEACVWGKKK